MSAKSTQQRKGQKPQPRYPINRTRLSELRAFVHQHKNAMLVHFGPDGVTFEASPGLIENIHYREMAMGGEKDMFEVLESMTGRKPQELKGTHLTEKERVQMEFQEFRELLARLFRLILSPDLMPGPHHQKDCPLYIPEEVIHRMANGIEIPINHRPFQDDGH